MELGVFSLSLNVKDLEVSKAFYEKLGFSVFGGNKAYNYLIMKNGKTLIGLFQGMFSESILTFNPGWDENANEIPGFTDIRELEKQLKEKQLVFEKEIDTTNEGPASFMLKDPDGNMILIDQHI